MEHKSSIQGLGDAFVTRWTVATVGALNLRDQQAFAAIVNLAGQLSAAAQGLKAPITDFTRLLNSGDQILYLAAKRTSLHKVVVFGGLKVGRKKLWVWPPGERAQTEVHATCVLDFYVHESIQRHGVGRQLFEAFLADAGTTADRVAYDMPSPKCQAFLTRHYGLVQPMELTNNYVVFPGFFQNLRAPDPPAQDSPWATVAVRPLTSKRSRGRQSSVAKQDPTAGLLWAGMLPPQAAAPGSGISSRMGSFSQPRRVGERPGGGSGSTNAALGQQSWLQGSPTMPVHGDPGEEDPTVQSFYEDVRSSWQQRDMEERSIAAHRAAAQGPAPITRHHGTLPPLTKPKTGMKHFTEADNDSVSAWMSESSKPADHRPQTKISPLGKAQRSGANAGMCLRW